MGAMSRHKGARGELEVVRELQARGIDARRTAPMQAGGSRGDADVLSLPGVHIEVKRQERLCLDQWSRQAEADAPAGAMPVVAYRRSREPWRVALLLDDFLDLLQKARA